MTRSIFDPGGDTERSGSRYTGPEGKQISHLPEDVTDGKVNEEESQALDDGEVNVSNATEEGAPRDLDSNDADTPRSDIEDE